MNDKKTEMNMQGNNLSTNKSLIKIYTAIHLRATSFMIVLYIELIMSK